MAHKVKYSLSILIIVAIVFKIYLTVCLINFVIKYIYFVMIYFITKEC
jgi:hypothetical protein